MKGRVSSVEASLEEKVKVCLKSYISLTGRRDLDSLKISLTEILTEWRTQEASSMVVA